LIITILPAAFAAATATAAIAIATTRTTGATALSAATATRSTETAATATATRTTTRASFFTGASFVNLQGTAFQLFAIQAIDSSVTLCFVRHLNETETARLAGELILNYSHRRNLTEGGESSAKIFFARAERQVTNVDIHQTLLIKLYNYPITYRKVKISGIR
jgi:hypothetical protein